MKIIWIQTEYSARLLEEIESRSSVAWQDGSRPTQLTETLGDPLVLDVELGVLRIGSRSTGVEVSNAEFVRMCAVRKPREVVPDLTAVWVTDPDTGGTYPMVSTGGLDESDNYGLICYDGSDFRTFRHWSPIEQTSRGWSPVEPKGWEEPSLEERVQHIERHLQGGWHQQRMPILDVSRG